MTMTQTVDNAQDIMDSRDVIARIEELKTDITYGFEAEDEIPDFDNLATTYWWKNEAETASFLARCEAAGVVDEAEELATLMAFADEAEATPDWIHGETLIRESYFEDYARDLADDIGAIKSDAGWPNSFIDWEAAAEALKQDYGSAEFDGVTYLFRY